tara:strand:- start:2354 stop:2557 length:204 start_codon:yes stop_codon:yes gene_type:complete
MKPQLKAYAQFDVVDLACLDHLYTIGHGGSHRLLSQDMLAGFSRQLSVLGMQMVRGSDKYDIHSGVS